MAKLTSAERNALPDSDFAGPELKEKIDARADKVLGKRPKNPHGNPGHHPSTTPYEHEGREHTSEHR